MRFPITRTGKRSEILEISEPTHIVQAGATDGYWSVAFNMTAKDRHRSIRLVGSKHGVDEILDQLCLVAPTEARVLITGPSGTGKNLIAEMLHLLHETRWVQRFRRTNLGALVPELAASQLFGHVMGAFTGAIQDSVGLVREADGGTLFLDQLSDAPANVQDMLLTLLEVDSVNPLGRHGAPGLTVDIRVVAATLESPEELLRASKIRHDLFYRIMEYHIALPALQTRSTEILPLATHALQNANSLRRGMTALTNLDNDAAYALLAHAWPGNVRELDHTIRAAVIASRKDPTTTTLRGEWLQFNASPPLEEHDYRSALAQFNHDWALRAFNATGTAKLAAKMMGISQDTYRKFRDWSRLDS